MHLKRRDPVKRCTSDCGAQTPESPALRGFVSGAAAFRWSLLYPCTFFERPNLPQKGCGLARSAEVDGQGQGPSPYHKGETCHSLNENFCRDRSRPAFPPQSRSAVFERSGGVVSLGSAKNRTQRFQRANSGGCGASLHISQH